MVADRHVQNHLCPALRLVWSGLGQAIRLSIINTCSDDFPGGRNVNVVVLVLYARMCCNHDWCAPTCVIVTASPCIVGDLNTTILMMHR